jgi:hypothetical protein
MANAKAEWAGSRVAALVEIWGIIAEYSGFVGARRLALVCKTARDGARAWLRTLPGMVVFGVTPVAWQLGGLTCEVWRLDLGNLEWTRMANPTHDRRSLACCAVRGNIIVLGGQLPAPVARSGQTGPPEWDIPETASVEILQHGSGAAAGQNAFRLLSPLSCGPWAGGVAIAIDETHSNLGQVIIIGESGAVSDPPTDMQKVDLATGVCTPQPSLLPSQDGLPMKVNAAARLPDGRVVCAGTNQFVGFDPWQAVAQVLEPPEPGSPTEANWQWRALPGTSVGRHGGKGCVLSDGRFAVFGGKDNCITPHSSCEALTLDEDGGARWDALSPMHEARTAFACEAIGGCVIVAGGSGNGVARLRTVEVYEEAVGRWRMLPCSLHTDFIWMAGSALLQ